MATFAVLNTDNVVVDVILADNLEIALLVTNKPCVEYTNENPAGIGYVYDGTIFVNPMAKPTQSETNDESSSEI